MKALSIRQPWADLIIRGEKRIENRKWKTNYRGHVLIHASKLNKTYFDAAVYKINHIIDYNYYPETPTSGGIIGQADLVEIVTKSKDLFFEGPYGWVFENIKPLKFYPCKGKLGLFKVNYPFGETNETNFKSSKI